MNLKKIGLTALAGSLVATSVFAAALDVTGGASLNFTGQEKTTVGNGWSMNDEVTFSASGEMDNGWNVSVSMQLDGSESTAMDNRSITIDMGDTGTLVFSGHGGDGALSAVDDKMPTAYEESWDVVDGATTAPSGPSSNNMFHYTNSTIMDSVVVKASYTPSGTGEAEGSTDIGITYTGIDNLTVGLATGDNKATANASVESTNAYAVMTFNSFTLGVQTNEADSETASADIDMTAYAISYAMDENLSISYGVSEMDYEDTTLDNQESTAVGISYTMGSVTLAASHNTVDNVAGTAANDNTGYEVNLAFAF
jgi:outer membrane protein OmpU